MRRIDYSWVILGTGFTVLFFSGGSRFAFGLMLKPMSEDLDVSRSTLSAVITTFMVVSAVALPFVGRLVDRWSLRGTIAIGAVAGGVGIGLMGRVDAVWQVFLVYGAVYALGNAGTSVSPVAVMVSQWFSNRRGIATSTAVAGNAIGQLIIVMLLASALVSLGWRWSYSILGAANLVVLAPLALLLIRPAPAPSNGAGPAPASAEGDSPTSETRRIPGTLAQTLTSRQSILLFLIYTVCGFQDFLVATHVVAFAQDQGVGDVLAGNLLALMGLLGLAGVLASGVLADAMGAKSPTALCFVLRIAAFALVLYWQTTPGIIVFGLLYGFTFLMTAPLTVVFVGNIFGTARLGTLAGSVSAVHQIAGGLGAFAGGWIFDTWGSYNGAFALLLGLSIAATGATQLVRERRAGETPHGVTAC